MSFTITAPERIPAFLACAVALAIGAAVLADGGASSPAAIEQPAPAVAAQRTRAELVARRFISGYLRYLDGSHRVPAGVTGALARSLRAGHPVISPAEKQRPLRLLKLTLPSGGGLRVRVLLGDGEGVQCALLLRLADAHGRLLVTQVQAGTR